MVNMIYILDIFTWFTNMTIHSFIDHNYTSASPNSSCRGHILVCLNCLRLRADADGPQSFLQQHFSSHQPWRHFYARLIADTTALVDRQREQVKLATSASRS